MIYGDDYGRWSWQTRRTCGNCGKRPDDLVYLSEWKFYACPECAEWCRAVERAEHCPILQQGVNAANSVAEVRAVLKAHDQGCVQCGRKNTEYREPMKGAA